MAAPFFTEMTNFGPLMERKEGGNRHPLFHNDRTAGKLWHVHYSGVNCVKRQGDAIDFVGIRNGYHKDWTTGDPCNVVTLHL